MRGPANTRVGSIWQVVLAAWVARSVRSPIQKDRGEIMTTRTLTRRIIFYRAFVGLDDERKPKVFDAAPLLKSLVGNLSFDDGSQYLGRHDHDLAIWIDRVSSPQRLQLAAVRRAGLPPVEDAGRLRPLNLAATAGLAEMSHVVFFPDGIVGVEFNFKGVVLMLRTA